MENTIKSNSIQPLLPIARKISPISVSDSIKPMALEEVTKAIGEIFENIKTKTGFKPIKRF